MEPTVVILLSDKRSGSTIFQDEFCRHPEVTHVEYSPHTYFETQHWLKAARLLEMPRESFYGHQYPNSLKLKSAARKYLVECLQGNLPQMSLPADDHELVFDGWEQLCHRFAKPVFFEKSPQHLAQWGALSLLLKWIRQTSYRVQILGLVRNPQAVLYSAAKLFVTDPTVRQFGWADMHRNLLTLQQLLPAEQLKIVHYESMIGDPQAFFGEVQSFIGLQPSSSMGQGVHANSSHKWRQDPHYALQLHESVSQIAASFGYHESDLENPGKSQPPAPQRVWQRTRNAWISTHARIFNGMIKPGVIGWKRP